MKQGHLAGFVALLALGCHPTTTAPNDGTYHELPSDQVLINAMHTSTVDGVRSSEGVFDTVYVYEDSASYRVRGLNLRMYNPDGVQRATIKADSGRWNTSTDALIALGHVVLITQDGCNVQTEELHYDPNTKRVWSDVPTRFDQAGNITNVRSFSADDQFTTISARGVNGRLPGSCESK